MLSDAENNSESRLSSTKSHSLTGILPQEKKTKDSTQITPSSFCLFVCFNTSICSCIFCPESGAFRT